MKHILTAILLAFTVIGSAHAGTADDYGALSNDKSGFGDLGGSLGSIGGIFGGLSGFFGNRFRPHQQSELDNANAAQNGSEDNQKERESRNGVGRRLLPKGFFSFAVILYGFVFFGVLLLWRIGGGRW